MHNVVVLQFAGVLSLYKMIAWVRKPFAFILHLNIRKRERELSGFKCLRPQKSGIKNTGNKQKKNKM